MTILLVEQNAVRAVEFADRSYVLNAGRLVLSGNREEMRGREKLAASYLGSATVDGRGGEGAMTDLIQHLIDALSLGSLYALLALGVALIFGIMNLINFAYGELIMIGAFTLYVATDRPGRCSWWSA